MRSNQSDPNPPQLRITSISERFDNTRFADSAGSDIVKYCKGQAANLLVEQPTKFDLVINMKTCQRARHCSAANATSTHSLLRCNGPELMWWTAPAPGDESP